MDVLSLWTVYAHPADYPDGYVVRRWRIDDSGPEATTEAYGADSLEEIRKAIPPGLHRLDRAPEDDPTIVETWI